MKNIKNRLKQGETVHGCWLNIGSSLTAEIVGLAGFDWVLIDLEHGSGSENGVLFQLQALEHTPTVTLVRVESGEGARVQKVLDMGAQGVMCPKIQTPEAARKFANGLHYPPLGSRGVAKMVRATRFGQTFDDYYKNAPDQILGIAQIETVEILDHLDEVAAIDGIDVLFIGPADLTMELGIFGQFDNPVYLDAVRKIVAAADRAGKATGILFFNPDEYQKYHDIGIRMIGCGADATFVADGAKNLTQKLNAFRTALQSKS